MSGRLRRLFIAVGVTALLGAALTPSLASANAIDDLVNQVKTTVTDTVQSLGLDGSGGGGSAGSGGTSSSPTPAVGAPSPQAGVPPTYIPPAHGTNPHGQGTVGVVDLTPEDSQPLPYDEGGGSEDIVAGRARGEQNGDGSYHGHITIASLFGSEILGVDTTPGQTEAGPLDPIQTGLLDAICDGSGNQVCLQVLTADSSTTGSGSTNSFAVAQANIGGPTGITAGAASSNGEISEDGQCQTAHGDSTTTNANVGGALTADLLESSSDSTACNDGSDSQTNASRVVNLNDTGLPVPEPGCADGTPNSDFPPLLPLLGAVCNAADDGAAAQMADPYGVREALSLFVLDVGGVPLVKTTTTAAESHAVAPGGGQSCAENPNQPKCDNGNVSCADDPNQPKCDNGNVSCADDPDQAKCDNGNVSCSDDPDQKKCENAGNKGGGPFDNGRGNNDEALPFTGADLLTLGLIGLLVMGSGLGLMALADRRRRVSLSS